MLGFVFLFLIIIICTGIIVYYIFEELQNDKPFRVIMASIIMMTTILLGLIFSCIPPEETHVSKLEILTKHKTKDREGLKKYTYINLNNREYEISNDAEIENGQWYIVKTECCGIKSLEKIDFNTESVK